MRPALISCLVALKLAAGSASAVAQVPAPAPVQTAAASEADPAKVAWLRAHEIGSGPVAGPLALRLPEALLHARLILLGESHGSAAPQVVDLALLTELNRRTGLRDYVAEVDPVQAITLNRYLDTGDEAALVRVFSAWKDVAQWGNTAFMGKVRGVRSLNLRLPADRRVHFIGLDAVQDWPLLLDWLEANGAPVDRSAITSDTKDSVAAATAATWLDGAVRAPAFTRERLRTLLSLTAGKAGREKTLFESYAQAVRSGELGDRQAYGLWGLFHVMQAGISGAKPFAMQVRGSTLPAAASMASIVILSLDSAVMIPGKTATRMTTLNVDGPFVVAAGAQTLRAASRRDAVVLWRLDAPGSPYRSGADLVTVETKLGQSFKPTDPALPSTAYAQYAGVFRGSDWAPPIR